MVVMLVNYSQVFVQVLSTYPNPHNLFILDKKVAGKSKAEQMNERQLDLERRLLDVSGQLGSSKKSAKKGKPVVLSSNLNFHLIIYFAHFYQQKILTKQVHKLPTANHHQVVLVIHRRQVHPIAVLVTVLIAKQVRRLMSQS
jgi:hypothetical protein